ncbi:MAG: porin family protein [Planctomycetota bacterium]|jgi:hypothetical protein
MKAVVRTLFLGVVLALGFQQPAEGQVLLGILFGDKLATERFHIGFNVGINVADFSGIDDTDFKTGLMLGLVAEWKIAGNFYLQPELLPFYKVGASGMPPLLDDAPQPLDTLVAEKDASRKLSYFEIPVIAKYATLGNRLHIGAGPQVGILLGAEDVFTGVIENVITVQDDIEDELNSFDAGVSFQVEYKLSEGPFAASISARYYLGLTDTIKDNPGDAVYNRVLTVFGSVPMGGGAGEED